MAVAQRRRRADAGEDEPRDEPRERVEDVERPVRDVADEARGATDRAETLTQVLRETVRDAAIEVLKPVVRKATTTAAKVAVKRGPDMVRDRLAPKLGGMLDEAGGAGALAKT